jgi:hypothetical protein
MHWAPPVPDAARKPAASTPVPRSTAQQSSAKISTTTPCGCCAILVFFKTETKTKTYETHGGMNQTLALASLQS